MISSKRGGWHILTQKQKKIKKSKHAQKIFFRYEREKTSKEGGRELSEQGGKD